MIWAVLLLVTAPGIVFSWPQAQLPVAQLLLYGLERMVRRFDLVGQTLPARKERCYVIATPLGLADGLRMGVALGAQPIALKLPVTPLGFECVQCFHV